MPAATLIGRDHPAASLRAHVERATHSHGGLVLVTGEAGIGKTTLVTDAADAARAAGAQVLSGSCWDSDSAPGYWPWVQVLRALRRSSDGGANAPALDVLLGDASPSTPDGEEGADGFALYDAVTSALVAESVRRPVIVVIDDLHWADPASLRLLEFAARHAWFERLLLVCTYRDAEVETAGHPLEPLILPLLATATTITLTGLDESEVGALIARTVGHEPEPGLVREVHRRTGGNPFFIEQTARLWRSSGTTDAIAPGVRAAVRQRLAQLPDPVQDMLTAAAVLGREFHRRVLAATLSSPAPVVDRLLDQAVAARLVVGHGAGRFGFAHDLVRETLYDALDPADLRRRHAAVIAAADGAPETPGLGDVPSDLARHAFLAGDEIDRDRAVDIILAAATDADNRLAADESAGHYRRALELVPDERRRALVQLQFGRHLQYNGEGDTAWRLFLAAASTAADLGDPDLLVRVAIMLFRCRRRGRDDEAVDRAVRLAHKATTGADQPGTPTEQLAQELIVASATAARHGHDDETLGFSLSARHDTIWGPGTSRERIELTKEMAEVARRTADHDLEQYATSLRWVALLEQGDPAYLDQVDMFVELAERLDTPRFSVGAIVDRHIIALLLGRFDEAEDLLERAAKGTEHGQPDYDWMIQHLRWAFLLRTGRWAELNALTAELRPGDYGQIGLLRAIAAIEQGDVATAAAQLAAADPVSSAYVSMRLRLATQVAAASGDPDQCAAARAQLVPYRGEWTVGVWGCDISGPIDLWIATLDAATGHVDDAIAGFTAAEASAIAMRAPAWALDARLGRALLLLDHGDDSAHALLAEVRAEAAALGLPYLVERASPTAARPVVTPAPDAAEFRRDGPVWTLTFGGSTTHMPDTKGLRDLHTLMSVPDTDIPAVRLLDPAGGAEVTAAASMGGDAVLDERAKAEYRRRLDALDTRIDDTALAGDDDAAARYDRERQALLTELRTAAGLGGRTRRLGEAAERARKTVTARIRDTLRKLDETHPGLAAHLRDRVSTGSTCRYAGDSTNWRL
ncbi:MAG TPA: AAA family ATPase [Actinokineospora sp.]|nr:AAA family ATPase [Actinokineospora sp.]